MNKQIGDVNRAAEDALRSSIGVKDEITEVRADATEQKSEILDVQKSVSYTEKTIDQLIDVYKHLNEVVDQMISNMGIIETKIELT